MAALRMFTICLAILATGAGGACAGEVAAGLTIARQRCAYCHNIKAGEPSKPDTPSFADIAKRRDEAGNRPPIEMPSFHGKLPGAPASLPDDDMDNVIAYIVSLDQG